MVAKWRGAVGVTVGVGLAAAVVGDIDAADYERQAGLQAVQVEAVADAEGQHRRVPGGPRSGLTAGTRAAAAAAAAVAQLPLSLLKTAQGHPMLVELKNGETYNGHLVNCDTWMNIHLREVICTSRDGDRFWRMPECYVRGNTIKYLRVPDEVIDKVQEETVKRSGTVQQSDKDTFLAIASPRVMLLAEAAAGGEGVGKMAVQRVAEAVEDGEAEGEEMPRPTIRRTGCKAVGVAGGGEDEEALGRVDEEVDEAVDTNDTKRVAAVLAASSIGQCLQLTLWNSHSW
eukprot:SM000005S17250  [mRNA]  locus=s5:987814:990514:+ [translate_table: standard]